jgi:hypothetical protein
MKKTLVLIVSVCCCFIARGMNNDTIIIHIDMSKYKHIAIEKLREAISLSKPSCILKSKITEIDIETGSFYHPINDMFTENDITIFSIPTFEWKQKAQEFTCASHEKLENLLLFEENPYFQMVCFIDYRSNNIIGGENISISEIRVARRIRDSIDWISQIPDIPPYIPYGDPFPYYDINDLQKVYKYHLKHPDAFIFRIANYEGFWVIKNYRLYKLENGVLKNANQYFYLSGETYIRDIANDAYRIGYEYLGCFSKSDALYWSKEGRKVFIKITKEE